MKITDVKIFAAHQFVYVKIVTDEGLHGLGEASQKAPPPLDPIH